MDNETLKYLKLVGEINSVISKTDSFDEAVKNALHIYAKKIRCNYAIFWSLDKDKEYLRPLYWIGNKDFTGFCERSGMGFAGVSYKNQEILRLFDFKKHPRTVNPEWLNSSVTSMIVVPFSSVNEQIGCVQLIRCDSEELFNDEDADLAELLSLMISSKFEDQDLLDYEWPYNEVLLSAHKIEKTFYNGSIETRVLKGINLDVYKGEFLVVLGASGCGKSTFLNVIGGMDRATGGTFTFMGKEMSDVSDKELTEYRRKNIGFIFQNYNLMPNLTAIQNLDIIGELVKNRRSSKELLEMVGLGDKLHSYPSQLSGGQQQRVSIARSLVKNPVMIFADEPTAALDYKTSVEVLQVMADIVKAGTTMLVVTHNEEIAKMANRVIRMRDGKIFETVINKHPLNASELVW